jgi:hypothetical protein
MPEEVKHDYQFCQYHNPALAHTNSPCDCLTKTNSDTILTPFSHSSATDSAVDSLPDLFLAYCILADSDDIIPDHDRVAPRGSGLDPVPLLTSCALGLSSTFVSRSRR